MCYILKKLRVACRGCDGNQVLFSTFDDGEIGILIKSGTQRNSLLQTFFSPHIRRMWRMWRSKGE